MTPSPRRMAFLTACILAPVIVVIAVVALVLRDRGDDGDFFALAAPRVCNLPITLLDAHFAAHIGAATPATRGDKFVVVHLAVANTGSNDATLASERFSLAAARGQGRQPDVVDAAGTPLPSKFAAGSRGEGVLVFSLPAAAGAAKMVYDDGCAHQEWLVP